MTTSKPRIGIVGLGYWGPNLLRNCMANSKISVVGLVDSNRDVLNKFHQQYPHISIYNDFSNFLKECKPDAVVIATPPGTHRELALSALEAGANILVEKPLALSSAECMDIVELAAKKNKIVMVDHTFVYHPAVEYLEKQVMLKNLGEILYYDSARVNLGGFQPKANVLWDLAPHDLSILDLLTQGKEPKEVSAIGKKYFNSPTENVCYVNLSYDNDFIAHLHLSWSSPIKLRTIMLVGDKKMAIYDDNLPTEKIKIYDKSVQLQSNERDPYRVDYRVGDMTAPALSSREALQGMVEEFSQCLINNRRPKTNGEAGIRIVRTLEAASQSLLLGGMPVEVSSFTKKKLAA